MRFRRIIPALLLTAAIGLVRASAALAASTSQPASNAAHDRAVNNLAAFLQKKAALKPGDLDAILNLARWARDRQLYSQSSEMASLVLEKDPANVAAWSILKQIDEAVPLPDEPQTAAKLIAEFNKRFHRDAATFAHARDEFKTRNSQHFLICYDTSDAFAAAKGGTLEKAYTAFMFYFTMQKLRPQFLQHRLVVILFRNRADFLAYAKDTEGADLSWAAGYYSQNTNRTAFYDDSTGPAVAAAERQIDRYRDRVKQLNGEIQSARERHLNGLTRNLQTQRDAIAEGVNHMNTYLGNEVALVNTVKTAHEAAHQLAFNTGIQKRLVDYPLWLSEGLACSFEVPDSNGYRGPAVLNPGRIASVKFAILHDKLIPLDQFITQRQPPKMNPQTLDVFYAEGWSLFHYLYKTNRPGLEKYLLAYKSLPPIAAIPPEKRRELFVQSFGDDFPTLQKRFVDYLKSLPGKPL